jgi:hypothetical protein
MEKMKDDSQLDWEADMRYEKWIEAQEARAELMIKYGEAKTDE